MKHFLIVSMIAVLTGFASFSFSQQQFPLMEEEGAVWESLLKRGDIKNTNLFYAGAVAYRDRLNDLSIETFNACMIQNPSHEIVRGVSEYYIGKNLFLMGKYPESIEQFKKAYGHDFGEFKILKYSVLVDTAVAYLRMNNTQQARSILGHVASTGDAHKFQGIAKGLLQQLR
ncbi:MAG TPA: hypothetical protein PK200_01570 [Spirochaetota bacterium]|nr:hypothetical protein [Spirochaetota bacterium]HQP49025.1 hypothetical protein [Spirochaetota bacterium]